MTGRRWLVPFVAAITAVGTVLAGGGAAHAANPNAAAVAWSPTTSFSTYDFGTVDGVGGQHPTQIFTLTNSGSRATGTLAPVALTNTSGTAFSITSDGCSGLSLGPTTSRSCDVAVKYAPTNSGESDSAALTASGEHANASITLTGMTGTPDLTLSPGALGLGPPQYPGTGTDPNGTKSYNYEFGSGSSATQTFTVTNGGNGTSNALQLAGLLPNSGFALSNDQTSGVMLPPGGTSQFQLTFTAPAGCSTQLFATPLLVTSTTASPDIRVTYSASCGPAITSVSATLDNLTAAFEGNPQFVPIGNPGSPQPMGVFGTVHNVNCCPPPPTTPRLPTRLHSFTLQIPFSNTLGTLNCYSGGYGGTLLHPNTCSVSNNVLTATINIPTTYVGWGPNFSKQISYTSVGSSLPTGVVCCNYVTWGKPTVTAAS